MGNNINAGRFISGTPYCISELFSGDNDKIVIPDLQRDYCWGSSPKDLVGKFLDTILSLDFNKEITMGLVYGYFNTNLTVEHVQLCDGQQRLTTLFLLMGEINRVTNNSFSHLLMSSFEDYEDDQEPYLQYSIRESSLYFLSDFTKKYFLSQGLDLNDVKIQPWFLKSYEQDPTIMSILAAVYRIKEKLLGKEEQELINIGNFVSHKLKFLFYDMGDRKNGEETFVVINTTGEPLTANQNLKPLFISKNHDKIADQNADYIWEEMETWFWRNRNRESKYPHTSDEGFTSFLQCAAMVISFLDVNTTQTVEGDDSSEDAQRKLCEQYSSFAEYYDLLTNPAQKTEGSAINYSLIPLSRLWEVFIAYQKVYTMDYTERLDNNIRYEIASNTACGYTQKQLYSILPTLSFCIKFPNADDSNIKRLYHIFRIISQYKDLSRPITPTLRALISVSEMKIADPICLQQSPEFLRYNEECTKLSIIEKESPERREETEMLFSRAEAHDIFAEAKDSILILIEWGNYSIDEISKYLERFSGLWTVSNWKKLTGNFDTLRRALLAYGLEGFPIGREKLCSDRSEWYRVISNNRKKIKDFLDIMYDNDEIKNLEDIITEYLSPEKCTLSASMRTFVSDKSLIRFCEQKKVCESTHCLEVLKGVRRYDYKIIYNGILYEPKLRLKNCIKKYTDNVLYVDIDDYNLTVDFQYNEDEGYRIIVWSGKYPNLKSFMFFDELLELGYSVYDKSDKGLTSPIISEHQEAHDKLYGIISWIEGKVCPTD